MTTYKCVPGATVSTSIDPQGSEFTVEFDKDGTFTTDNFHLITVLDQMASDPNSPVSAANAAKKAAPVVAETPAPTTEEDES